MKSISEKFKSGLYGVIVGDALGNPVQFKSREEVRKNPVTKMLSGGAFKTPEGTWTDDSSMTLCLAESIGHLKELDYEDVMDNFVKWFDENEFTPLGEAFDIGKTTSDALFNYMNGKPIFECGGMTFSENGNGALMRILPAAFYVYKIFGKDALNPENPQSDEAFTILHNIAALTHGHWVSLIACDFYCAMLIQMISGKDAANGSTKEELMKIVQNQLGNYSEKHEEYSLFLKKFRIFDRDFKNLPDEKISSSGYVLDSLEAALWCFLNTDNYKDCVLKAVNLGGDADTIGDIAGGLAAVFYDDVPESWINELQGKEVISGVEKKFVSFLDK